LIFGRGVDLRDKDDVANALSSMFEDEPLRVATIFDQFIRGLRNSWDLDLLEEAVTGLFKKLLMSENPKVREIGRRLVDFLGAQGRLDYRDLLKVQPSNL
jgi:hypothetical protein